jgi:hypothetical protein
MGSSWLPSLSLDIKIMLAFATLHNYHISYNMFLVAKDLGHLVKPRNVTWYSFFFSSLNMIAIDGKKCLDC